MTGEIVMSDYDVSVAKAGGEVFRIVVGRGDISITVYVCGGDIARWIIERGSLDENLMPPKEVQEAFQV